MSLYTIQLLFFKNDVNVLPPMFAKPSTTVSLTCQCKQVFSALLKQEQHFTLLRNMPRNCQANHQTLKTSLTTTDRALFGVDFFIKRGMNIF